ncbi:hypothetical protein J6590_045146 [Homalodisca vitripennis]|nr:hypothetical protein J6590_045146 [Homalodisca vitripennis]
MIVSLQPAAVPQIKLLVVTFETSKPDQTPGARGWSDRSTQVTGPAFLLDPCPRGAAGCFTDNSDKEEVISNSDNMESHLRVRRTKTFTRTPSPPVFFSLHCGAANTQQYGGAGVSHPTEESRLAPPLFTSPLSSLL